jgi:P4 family phage/plasmid primase-like protien
MNTNTCKYKDLSEFLAKHTAKNSDSNKKENISYTHTRIPNKELNIYPGCYVIPKEELQNFYSLYYDKIFVKKQKEYLTEKQLETGGAMAVDFDFRYDHSVINRQHTREHINDMICEYIETLKECYLILPNSPFSVYIFEKPNVNRLEDGSLTKDGIHMIIGLQVDYTMQLIIRDKMIEKLPEIWELPLINNWESVLDEGISTGKTGWQLFGSRKPGNDAYELTHHYVMTLDGVDNNFTMDEKDVSNFDLKTNFEKLSVRYDKNPKFELNPRIFEEYNARLQIRGQKNIKKASSKIKMNLITDDDTEYEEYISINDIKDKETLDRAVDLVIKSFQPNEYEIVETHQYTQALPAKFYEPGSHLLNRQVGFALKHTDERLFLSWVQLRSKADDFDYNSIPELYSIWKKFHKTSQNGSKVTRKSIMYWLKNHNYDEYIKIKSNTVDYYLEIAYKTETEYDLAVVLKQMCKDEYVCVSYEKKGIWYKFANHKWVQDRGLSLRNKISEELCTKIQKNMHEIVSQSKEFEKNDENGENPRLQFFKKKIKSMVNICTMLKRTNSKNNIMREAAEIFYDNEFIKNMDTNKYLMCFNNGVVDFTNKTFREGYPEDYITKSTRINYIPSDELTDEKNESYIKIKEEIIEFMRKLFPIEDLNRYMWDHLASCLIGANKNQTFNVYHGSGSNGKSILADLMSVTLGDYKGTVPITLVTDVRGKIGGTSDEVLKLKGVRYAVMQEPSKNVKLNEGIMKELTGGDPLQARGLYSESEIFDPQFNLVVCTNNLFDIESNDDGTWRRIRNCDFLSKFVDEKEKDKYKDMNYVFEKDKSLKDKLPSFAPIFASLLVKRAFETGGLVEDCNTVLEASNKYRNSQDYISAFINESIIKTNESKDKIGKQGLNQAFKQWFEKSQGSRKVPKVAEVHEVMNNTFGNPTKDGKWCFVKFIEPDKDDDDDELPNL